MPHTLTEKVYAIVYDAIEQLNEQLPAPRRLACAKDSVLLGRSGGLDSFDLVNLIVAVEEGICEVFGKHIAIADEKAVSRQRSPFRTVESLCRYIVAIL